MKSFSVRIIQIGAIAIVLVASTLTVFDLDRFLVPKELVLHATVPVVVIPADVDRATMAPDSTPAAALAH